MGKSKQRLFGRAKNFVNEYNMTRHQAIDFVVTELSDSPASVSARKMISLFGLQPDELTEAGATYEKIMNLETALL